MGWTIAVLGLTHDHVWTHLAELHRRDDTVVAVAEPAEALRRRAQQEFGIARLYDAARALLERERPDAVLIFSDNAAAAPLVELAAAHALPVMLEKPLADSLASAERISVAAHRAGIPLMVNWPTAWSPEIHEALRLAQSGAIGQVFRFNFRGGHQGPRAFGCSTAFCDWLYDPSRNGAGAYIDYCGYGASLARLLLGVPSRVQATIGRLVTADIPVDDNAVLVLRYPHALATIEASWSAAGPVPDGGPVLWGRDATLVVVRSGPNRGLYRYSVAQPEGARLEVPPLPEGARSATEYFLAALAANRPIDGLVSLEVARDAQEMLEAGLQAARTGQEVSLPLRTAIDWRDPA